MSDVLLLSGGIDSTAVAAWKRPACCLTVDYGQIPAASEVAAAAAVCSALALRHEVLRIPLGHIGSGVLAGQPPSPGSINPEFWPFRNQLLITIAAMVAMKHHADRVLIGTVASDRRHVDGTRKFILQLGQVLNIQEGSVALEAPAIDHTSVELIRISKIDYGVLAWAHSCHTSNLACGRCPGCVRHSEVMQAIGWDR